MKKKPNGWKRLKSIILNFPIIEGNMYIGLDNDKLIETVISICLFYTPQTVCQALHPQTKTREKVFLLL